MRYPWLTTRCPFTHAKNSTNHGYICLKPGAWGNQLRQLAAGGYAYQCVLVTKSGVKRSGTCLSRLAALCYGAVAGATSIWAICFHDCPGGYTTEPGRVRWTNVGLGQYGDAVDALLATQILIQ